MKRMLLFFVILLCNFAVSVAQPNLVVRTGYNHSTWGFRGDDKNTWVSGFNIGATTDLGRGEHACFRPGIYFTAKGYGHDDGVVPRVSLNYLEMPLLAVFKIGLGDNVKLEFQSGVYFAYGIGGKTKIEDSVVISPKDNSKSIKYIKEKSFGSNSEEDPFDMGVNVGMGVNYKRLFVGVSYDFGVIISCKNTHNCFMANVGYRIF